MGEESRVGRKDQAAQHAAMSASDAAHAHFRGSGGFPCIELFAEAGEADEGEADDVEGEEREDAELAVAGVDDEGGGAIEGGQDFQDGDEAGGGGVFFRGLGAALRGADEALMTVALGFYTLQLPEQGAAA